MRVESVQFVSSGGLQRIYCGTVKIVDGQYFDHAMNEAATAP